MTKKLLLPMLALLSGCASIVSGTTQEIAISSSPSGAKCDLVRNGTSVSQITTPASPLIKKTKYDIIISCSKEGHQDTKIANNSGVEPWVFGNILFGGLIGLIIDVSTGAQNNYDASVVVNLPPAPAQVPAPPEPKAANKPIS